MLEKKRNILFLDYDGVINTEKLNFDGYFENPEAIYYINKFCLENNFDIVVSSSWRKHAKYKEFLYEAGLDKKVNIVGKTDDDNRSKEANISLYLTKHEVNKFIIFDDAEIIGDLARFQVRTIFKEGFTKEKYEEALEVIKIFDTL